MSSEQERGESTALERTRIDSSPLVVPKPATQPAECDSKPSGLWYEVAADWRRWCAAEEPTWLNDKYLHQLVLGGERMLELRSVAEFDQFHIWRPRGAELTLLAKYGERGGST